MHMHEQCHLVALDNRFNQDFSLFIVRLSILNPITPSMVSWLAKQKWPYPYNFALSPVLFFLFLHFQVGVLDPSFGHLHHHECHHLAPLLGVYQPISYHLEQRVSTLRFYQLSKTKLGLSAGSKPAWPVLASFAAPAAFFTIGGKKGCGALIISSLIFCSFSFFCWWCRACWSLRRLVFV